MKINGIQMLDGSVAENFTLASGVSFPPAEKAGELFYKTGTSAGLYVYDGAAWFLPGSNLSPGSIPGEVKLVAFSSGAPSNWLVCNGQPVTSAEWPELFASIGSTFGGDATTFNLPDLRNRVPMQSGTGSLGKDIALGSVGGSGTNDLSFVIDSTQMPAHSHTGSGAMIASNNPSGTSEPTIDSWIGTAASDGSAQPYIYAQAADDGTVRMATGSIEIDIANAGDGSPVDLAIPAVLPPYVGMNYIIYAGIQQI